LKLCNTFVHIPEGGVSGVARYPPSLKIFKSWEVPGHV
jgi:hypothetical protein